METLYPHSFRPAQARVNPDFTSGRHTPPQMTTVTTPARAARIAALNLGWPGLVQAAAALVAFAAMLFTPQVLNDADTYWHLAAGEWMLERPRRRPP